MSSWSAFGFSGFDPVGSFAEGLMGQYFLDKSARTQYKYAKKYAEWSATHGPKFTRQGLEEAGYNPMLAVSQGFNMPTFQTTGSPPSLGDTVSGYDPTVTSALQTQKAQRDLIKAETKKVKAETGATSPINALVSLVNTPEVKEAFRALVQKIFSTDGSQNNPEIPPAPSLLERFKAWNSGKATWSDLGVKDAERDATKLGLEGKERQKFIERARRRWNATH